MLQVPHVTWCFIRVFNLNVGLIPSPLHCPQLNHSASISSNHWTMQNMSESLSTQTSSNVHFQIARQCARCRLDYSHRSRVVLQSIVWHWFTSRPRNYNQHMPPDVHFCASLRLRSGMGSCSLNTCGVAVVAISTIWGAGLQVSATRSKKCKENK